MDKPYFVDVLDNRVPGAPADKRCLNRLRMQYGDKPAALASQDVSYATVDCFNYSSAGRMVSDELNRQGEETGQGYAGY